MPFVIVVPTHSSHKISSRHQKHGELPSTAVIHSGKAFMAIGQLPYHQISNTAFRSVNQGKRLAVSLPTASTSSRWVEEMGFMGLHSSALVGNIPCDEHQTPIAPPQQVLPVIQARPLQDGLVYLYSIVIPSSAQSCRNNNTASLVKPNSASLHIVIPQAIQLPPSHTSLSSLSKLKCKVFPSPSHQALSFHNPRTNEA